MQKLEGKEELLAMEKLIKALKETPEKVRIPVLVEDKDGKKRYEMKPLVEPVEAEK